MQIRGVAALLVAATALACGGDDAATQDAGRRATNPAASPASADGENSPPAIVSARFEPALPASGEPIRVVVDTLDPDGDRVRLSYRWKLDGRPTQGGGERIDLQGFQKGDEIEVTVTPSDGQLDGEPRTLRTRVRNRPPVVQLVRIGDEGGVQAGRDLHAVVDARDDDGDPVQLEYEWIVDGRHAGDGETLETEGLERGAEIRVRVVASDGEGESDPVESAAVRIGNTPPRIVSQPGSPDADGVFRYQVRAEDPDGDRGIVFRLAQAPEGMTIDRTGGEVTWQPGPDQVGSFPIAILADDRKGGLARQEFELSVAAPPAAPER